MNNRQNKGGLDRYLSGVDVWAMAFGCMVGWGAFVMPGTTFLPLAGPAGTLIALAISTVIMLVIGGSFTYLMRHNPGTGGVYSYTKSAFGRDHAFLCSWFLCLSYLTILFLNATALFIVIRTMFGGLLQVGIRYRIAGNEIYLPEVALSVIALMAVGLLFVRWKALMQRLYTVLSILLLLGALISGIACLPGAIQSGALRDFGSMGLDRRYAIFSIVILAPWAFVGFDVISFDTAHFRFPIKRARWVVFLSIALAGLVYACLAAISVSAVPEGYAGWQEYLQNAQNLPGVASVPAMNAVCSALGPAGLVIIGITALSAILTGMIGAYRATTRVLSTMAEDKILSEKFSNTSYSIVFVMLIAIVISFLGRNALNWFVDLTSFGAVVGYAYTSFAAWKLARAENNRMSAVLGAVGTCITIAFALVHLIPRLTAMEAMGSASFLLLSLWCLLGFVFYWRTVNNSTLSEFTGMSTSGVVLFALLLYAALMWVAKGLYNSTGMETARTVLLQRGIVAMTIVFIGLIIMLYVQNLLRKKHEQAEREKIRAVEGSLAKSQFLFNMSHDIRTPMNAIIGYTNLALQKEDNPEMRDYLSKIDTSSKHLLSLINDILEMSRIESGKVELQYEVIDLRAVMNDLKDLFEEQMQNKDIGFSVHINQLQHPYVWCDGKNFNRVLLNLLSNAYKFTPEGGTVSASIWEIGGENGYQRYEVRVQDSGIGMSREFADRMFNAFERERTSTVSGQEGTGLGLAIAKNILDLMDGTIEVITSPGSGSEFIIRVKLRAAKEDELPVLPAAPAAPKESPSEATLAGKRLLLVEDNEINREIALMILSQHGFRLETAENGKIAVDMVTQAEPGYYDAVLMDIQMPVMDGYTATRAIRALPDPAKNSVPILAMTANAFKEDEIAARQAGMQAHIAKPLDVDKMLDTLKSVLLR